MKLYFQTCEKIEVNTTSVEVNNEIDFQWFDFFCDWWLNYLYYLLLKVS